MFDYLAFLPIRRGSKGIPHKNIKTLGGKPLFHWVARAVLHCDSIGKLVISSDFEAIQLHLSELGFPEKIEVFKRSKESATSEASTEKAIWDFLGQNKAVFKNFILVQATSPLLTSQHLTEGIDRFEESRADSLLSVLPGRRFSWKKNSKHFVQPVNYDPRFRPRRQDVEEEWFENGAFYISTHTALTVSKCRVSGNIAYYEMPKATYFEIDDPQDWGIVETLLLSQMKDEG